MISDFGIKNFRSFNNEGVFLHDLQKVNIFIGKNNSGKSNFIRFLTLLSKHSLDHEKFPDTLYENVHKSNGGKTVFSFLVEHDKMQFPKRVYYNSTNHLISDYIPDPFQVDFTLSMSHYETRISLPELRSDTPVDVLRKMFIPNGPLNRESCISTLLSKVYSQAYQTIKTFKDIIYISDFRVIEEGNKIDESNTEINGSNIISTLRKMQVPDTGKEADRIKCNKLQDIIRKLLSIDDLIIEIPPDVNKIILTIHENIRQDLKSFGTGIHQLIMLCGALLIYSERLVCIEEPEIHLHPELQRKFLEFLITETNNQYFVTTHSNVFLNLVDQVSIYHVENNGVHSTCEKIETTQKAYRLLDDLGYKASDLLQSNGVIWVEGPSDRHLICKWLNLLNPELKEGLDFSVMYYGGRTLANCSFDPNFYEDNLIPLLRINRNAFVVIDKDNNEKINQTKSRIQAEIGDKSCWITKGREIENYLSAKTTRHWLESKSSYNGSPVVISQNLKFGEIVEGLSSVKTLKYDQRKSEYSLDLTKFIELEDLEILHLKIRIQQIARQIKRWNHLNELS